MIADLPEGESVAATTDRLRRDGRAVDLVPEAADKGELLDAFARALSLPAYFGHNLDALNDSLGDLHPGEPTTVVWLAGRIERDDPKLYGTVRQILEQSLPNDVDVLICHR
ncbi:hypothetical protein EK0264_02890 [Epidermidibacterium keratini]|uniref:Barstar (barnase inhibitor) domain-containing protein n=1 Tax=Epidermidibacterium keratini TaxID=1891644 RepID=A0A7L4YJ50_9ACTN|nr:barstar family protein [Epidermidibacterium keratini]QHB99334.1 hypothetical protein EK0264_02890 [Epidermidibacterium keratini]